MFDLIWLIPLIPLAGALLMLLAGSRLPKSLIAAVCTGTVAASFVLSLGAFFGLRSLPEAQRAHEVVLFTWLPLARADWGFLLDPLSAVMILIVTGIGLLIHLYSIGYMADDFGFFRFFGYLNLFVFFMLTLVLANNYALLFVGWEGVGLCSYLLIGYYFRVRAAGDAGKKAFVVNRVGDWGFLIGMLALVAQFGTLRFADIVNALRGHAVETGFGALSLIALCLFIGATGKSAQVPLYVWLPDAMEGPTPVSALIHAATMVTAGVYVVARSAALFSLTPSVNAIIAGVGAFTAILAALIALVQNDIKKVLAYSTVSQLGFMFMAAGVGAYWVAIFHLMTHAFFKALLFLGAGSVIHGMQGEQGLRRMGGLKAFMPVTFWTMMAGAMAISGIPGLSGYFSKDEILASAYLADFKFVYAVGLITALLTAFYMWRMMRLAFFGDLRSEQVHPHESPLTMTAPLAILALGSIVAGWPAHRFEGWLEPLFPHHTGAEVSGSVHAMLAGLAVAAALAGLLAALKIELQGAYTRVLENRFYVDEIYEALFVDGLAKGGGRLLSRFDARVVDGGVNGAAWLTRLQGTLLIWWDFWAVDGTVRLTGFLVKALSFPTRLLQTGSVQTYALFVVAGLLVMFGIYVTR